jgi:hypothetical protein
VRAHVVAAWSAWARVRVTGPGPAGRPIGVRELSRSRESSTPLALASISGTVTGTRFSVPMKLCSMDCLTAKTVFRVSSEARCA